MGLADIGTSSSSSSTGSFQRCESRLVNCNHLHIRSVPSPITVMSTSSMMRGMNAMSKAMYTMTQTQSMYAMSKQASSKKSMSKNMTKKTMVSSYDTVPNNVVIIIISIIMVKTMEDASVMARIAGVMARIAGALWLAKTDDGSIVMGVVIIMTPVSKVTKVDLRHIMK